MKSKFKIYTLLFFMLLLVNRHNADSGTKDIQLIKPDKSGGITVMSALNKRSSSRSFSDKQLSDQVLSNLFWAAYGINRPDSGKRTAPSAMNNQEIEIYAAMNKGLYKYNPSSHSLEMITSKDLRHLTGKQDFVKDALLNLVYVADLSRVAGGTQEEKFLYAGADTGFIGENVYLYCASEGLATVIRGYIDKEALGKAMNLKKNKLIVLSQSVGYPGK